MRQKLKGPRFIDLAVLWGLPVRGQPQLRCNVRRPLIGAALQGKSFPHIKGSPFVQRVPCALSRFSKLVQRAFTSSEVVELGDLAGLGPSHNCRKIPGGNVPDEKTPCVLCLVLGNALHMVGFQAFFYSPCQIF